MNSFYGKGSPLSEDGFASVSEALGGDACSLWALVSVETAGCVFFPDRRPKILFERHVFHRLTQGRYDAAAPDISSSTPRGYSRGAAEYARLEKACALDLDAGLASASWGLGQIMGFNASALGYADTPAMIDAFCGGEDAQLDSVLRFIRSNGRLEQAFRARDWETVALHYNGPNYAANEYDSKLEHYHARYSRDGVPDLGVRAAQMRLTSLGFDPRGIDGVLGQGTAKALAAFQRAQGIAQTAMLDDDTGAQLSTAAGY